MSPAYSIDAFGFSMLSFASTYVVPGKSNITKKKFKLRTVYGPINSLARL